MRKCITYTDFGKLDHWDFTDGLSQVLGCECKTITAQTNHLHGGMIKSLLRYLLYFYYPLKWVIRSEKCDYRIAWQQFFGINMAFFMRLFHKRKDAKLLIMTFIYNRRQGALERLYFKYIKYALSSEYVDKIVVFSSREVQTYKELFNIDKFVFIPLGIDDCTVPVSGNSKDSFFVFSTGRSNRDWTFLINALKDSGYDVKIATDSIDRDMNLPANINLLKNCFGIEMLEEMNKSFCVVIPLKNKDVSAGQLVILQAMSLGKPVIATRGAATTDYVVDGKTGYLIDNNPCELLARIKELKDDDNYKRMSCTAIEMFKAKHGMYSMGINCGHLLK